MNVEELRKKAEASWEGCHGCDDNDKNFWINGYIAGVLGNRILEIPINLPTDEEIQKESSKIHYGGGSNGWIQDGFRNGAKWMRDKIKGGQDE
jgi:hypothetical protein